MTSLRRVGSRIIAAGLLAGAFCVIVPAVILPQACAKDPPPPSAPDPIVIGVSFGLTNAFARFSAPLLNTIRAAEGEINAAGGLLGRPVRFDVVDDKSDEAAGVTKVVQDFADKGVAAVIGPIGSGQVKATQKILADRK